MLGDDKPDDDAMTRGQQKQIEALTKEVPPSPSKKAKMAKHTTMVGTAKVKQVLFVSDIITVIKILLELWRVQVLKKFSVFYRNMITKIDKTYYKSDWKVTGFKPVDRLD